MIANKILNVLSFPHIFTKYPIRLVNGSKKKYFCGAEFVQNQIIDALFKVGGQYRRNM